MLGAGASMHLGFPSGEELRRRVLEQIEKDLKAINNLKATSRFCNEVANLLPMNRDKLKEHLNCIAGALQFSPSVDHCLAQTADESKDRYEYAHVATALIKAIILFEIAEHQAIRMQSEEEKIKKWFSITKKEQDKQKENERLWNWYADLWFLMNQGLKTPSAEIFWQKNDVHFITFNYDSSLESFLYRAYVSTYVPDDTDAKEFLRILKERILHVYGEVIIPPWQYFTNKNSNDILSYHEREGLNQDNRIATCFRDRNNIKTFDDRNADNNQHEVFNHNIEIDSKIQHARIYILGSSLNFENMNILFPKRNDSERLHINTICGTRLGISDASLNVVEYFIGQSVKMTGGRFPFVNGNCADFMNVYKYILGYGE